MKPVVRIFLQWLAAVAVALIATLPVGIVAGYWQSYGFVLLTLVPFTIGFGFAYALPSRVLTPLLLGISILLLGSLCLVFYLALGLAGLLCFLVAVSLFILPFLVGVLTVIVLRYFRWSALGRKDTFSRLCLFYLFTLCLLVLDSHMPYALPEERVETQAVLKMSAADAWSRLLFFEDAPSRPDLLLRTVLPAPLKSSGSLMYPGDTRKCLYRDGHLVKQARTLVPARVLTFDVVEQVNIENRSVRLLDGEFRLLPLSPSRTRITLVTRYAPRLQARLLWRPWEHLVTHHLHRHVLSEIESARPVLNPLTGLDP